MHSNDATLCILLQGVFFVSKSPGIQEFLGEGVCRVPLRSHRRAQRAIVAVVEWEVMEQTEREVGL